MEIDIKSINKALKVKGKRPKQSAKAIPFVDLRAKETFKKNKRSQGQAFNDHKALKSPR
jgi:hypothetical protein